MVEECQKIAAAQSIRFSFLSGDVHVCGAGRLYSDPKVKPCPPVTSFCFQVLHCGRQAVQ